MKIESKIFRQFLACLVAVAVFLPVSVGLADGKEVSVVSVDGSAEVEAAPDEATVAIGVTTHDKDAAAAQTENARRAAALQNAAKALGIDGKDIKTRNYNFRPTYRRNERHENEINGYAVDNTVIIRVRNINLVGKVIDAALSVGANQVNSLNFGVHNAQNIKKEALLAATQDAKEKAEIIARGLGRRIIGVQRASANTGRIQAREFQNVAMLAAKADMDMATPIEAGTLTLSASVHIDFILED